MENRREGEKNLKSLFRTRGGMTTMKSRRHGWMESLSVSGSRKWEDGQKPPVITKTRGNRETETYESNRTARWKFLGLSGRSEFRKRKTGEIEELWRSYTLTPRGRLRYCNQRHQDLINHSAFTKKTLFPQKGQTTPPTCQINSHSLPNQPMTSGSQLESFPERKNTNSRSTPMCCLQDVPSVAGAAVKQTNKQVS